MVTYKISGTLPAPWEDFFSRTAGFPNVTIMTRENACSCGYEDDAPDDGWLDIVLDLDCIDVDAARLAIACALGIAAPEEIVIIQDGWCQAV